MGMMRLQTNVPFQEQMASPLLLGMDVEKSPQAYEGFDGLSL